MNIGVLGAGAMTTVLGTTLAPQGHRFIVSYSRSQEKLDEAARAIGHGAITGTPREAVAKADIVLLATGWDGAKAALAAAGDLSKKIIWSIVNPLRSDLSGLAVGTTTSGSEELAKLAPEAFFVAGWPPFADVVGKRFSGTRCTAFYCGDDADAKARVRPLIEALDVDAIDAGALRAARFVEPSMMLLIHLAYAQKLGSVAVQLLKQQS